MVRTLLFLLLAGTTSSLVFAQPSSGRLPDGESVVHNVEAAYAGITDYTVTIDVTVNLERLTVPPMHAVMYYKQPDKVHFDTESFAMLPREAALLDFGRLHAKYLVDPRVEQDTVEGARKLRVVLLPRSDKTRLKRVLLYVDPARWTADRLVIPLAGGRSVTTDLEYLKTEDRWLPSALTLKFAQAAADSSDPNLLEQITPTRRAQLARDGTVLIRYSNYRINSGLSDELFREEGTGPVK